MINTSLNSTTSIATEAIKVQTSPTFPNVESKDDLKSIISISTTQTNITTSTVTKLSPSSKLNHSNETEKGLSVLSQVNENPCQTCNFATPLPAAHESAVAEKHVPDDVISVSTTKSHVKEKKPKKEKKVKKSKSKSKMSDGNLESLASSSSTTKHKKPKKSSSKSSLLKDSPPSESSRRHKSRSSGTKLNASVSSQDDILGSKKDRRQEKERSQKSETKTRPPSTRQKVQVTLVKGKNGFGLVIVGGIDQPYLENDNGIFITKIKKKGAAKLSGELYKGDKILSINGNSCENVQFQKALEMFQGSEKVDLVVLQGAEEFLRQTDKIKAENRSWNFFNLRTKSRRRDLLVTILGYSGFCFGTYWGGGSRILNQALEILLPIMVFEMTETSSPEFASSTNQNHLKKF